MCLFVIFWRHSYEFFAKRQLVTLFSAPNYCGEFDNSGSLMSVGKRGKKRGIFVISLKITKQTKR
jgi:hypothetical protein